MATAAARMRALRERSRRGIRRLTIDVSEDDLREIAQAGYEAPQAPTRTADPRLSAVSLATRSPVSTTPAETVSAKPAAKNSRAKRRAFVNPPRSTPTTPQLIPDRRLLLLPQMIHDVGNFVDAFHRLLAFVRLRTIPQLIIWAASGQSGRYGQPPRRSRPDMP